MSDGIKIPSAAQLRLQMGEMTASEVRTAQSAYRLGYIAATKDAANGLAHQDGTNQLCIECGKPTMHMGNLCFGCGKARKAST